MKYFFANRRNGSRCRSAALPNTGAGVAFPEASGELASDAWVAVPQGLGARWGAAGCTVWKRGFPEMTLSHRLRMGTMTGHRWCGTAGGRGLGSSGRQKGSGCSRYSPPAPLKKGSRARGPDPPTAKTARPTVRSRLPQWSRRARLPNMPSRRPGGARPCSSPRRGVFFRADQKAARQGPPPQRQRRRLPGAEQRCEHPRASRGARGPALPCAGTRLPTSPGSPRFDVGLRLKGRGRESENSPIVT